ncbi:DUF1430 domain-containing protein, partial [Streptococcus danieliae]|nr:DUF1430 domain-containing protein [Streptococcus danieliae]
DEYASLEPKLIKHKLDTVIRGVTNVYHQYQVSIDTERKEVFVYGLALIIFFSIYIQLVIFNTLSYYEANMRELFVRYIMGHGFFKLNFEYIMLNIMSICLAVVGYIIIFDTVNIAIPVS